MLWYRWDTGALEHVVHGLGTHSVSLVDRGSHDAVIAPRAIVLGHADHQGCQLLVDLRTAWSLPLQGAVTLLGDQGAVPGEDGVRFDDRGDFLQGFLAQLLANLGQGLALAIAQAYTTFALVAKHAMFGHEVCIAH